MSIWYCSDHDQHFDSDHDTDTHRFCHDTSGVRFTEPTSWAPEFYFKSDGEWCGNAQRFATEAEAKASAHSRFMRWTMPTDTRAVPSDDPVNYTWDDERGDVPWPPPPPNCEACKGTINRNKDNWAITEDGAFHSACLDVQSA